MKAAYQVFADYLSKNKLKLTPQRVVILETFIAEHDHLSAEELYRKVRETDPSVGQATVYRTLKHLVDSGLAQAVHFGDGLTRYEPHLNKEHHDHLICESCGKSIELLDDEIERRQVELAKRHGFELTNHSMYLYGLCADCRKKK